MEEYLEFEDMPPCCVCGRSDRAIYCPLEHDWIDECPDECDMCPGAGGGAE